MTREERNAYQRNWYAMHREKVREASRIYREKNRDYVLELQAIASRKYRKGNKKYARNNIKRYKTQNPEKYFAGRTLRRAVLNGKIVKPNHCTRCGLICNPEGHHADYSKPLQVIWLCRPCHRIEDGRVMRISYG